MKRYRIILIDASLVDPDVRFGLVDEADDGIVRTSHDPRRLSQWAFDHGAQEVTQSGDVALAAEDIPWTR